MVLWWSMADKGEVAGELRLAGPVLRGATNNEAELSALLAATGAAA